MRHHLLWIVVCAGFINAVPANGQFRPLSPEPVSDEIMGSGREAQSALSGPRFQRHIAKPPRRAGAHRPRRGDRTAQAILAARQALLDREPELGRRLCDPDPAIRRDDQVGTMMWADNAIVFNRAYIASLSPDQLYDHVWQLGAILTTRL